MGMSFSPTAEQQAAVAAALTGENLVITAGAGSGKTSTLRLIADALAPKKGIYIAYNKAIATDAAASFPSNVECRTAHSFAYRAVGFKYQQRLKSGRMTGRQIASALGIKSSFPLIAGERELSGARVASLVMATINKWCHSADPLIGFKHAASVVAEVPGAEGEARTRLVAELTDMANLAWSTDLVHETGRLPFSHDMYVKVWALSNPTLPGDFILYDEAQDADPCIAGIVLAQKGKQLIAVGDECQAIYGWRGATDAMREWPAQHRVSLTKSFRFGPAVAAEANVFLEALKAPLRIEGFEKIDSRVGPVAKPSAILCRTNATMVQEALGRPGRFAFVGGTDQIKKFAEAAEGLMEGRSQAWHPDLGAFKRWEDVLDYVKNDDGGADLRSMVNMIDLYGVKEIVGVCERAVSEDRADVVLSTAHKAKGREWDHVVIADDFTPSNDGEGAEPTLSRSEAMLAYVAVTRAKLSLDASALAWAKSAVIA
jgi:superfamily I DNA/RNA helicase